MYGRWSARSAPSRAAGNLGDWRGSGPLDGVRTIAIINQKGGSGKTTTAINLAAGLARADRRVLLVDVDPQSHCALGLAVPESQIDQTIGDAMLAPDHRPIERDRLVWEASKGLDLIPSTTRLAGLEAPRGGLAERIDRDRRLAFALGSLADDYDWCLIDCPPFIGLLTFNALRAADEVLIPVETSYFALQGAMKQVNTIRALGRRLGVLKPFRVLPTLHDPGSPLACEILAELGRRFEREVIPQSIRYDAKLKEAVSAGVPVMQLDGETAGAQDYTALAQFYEAAPRLQAEEIPAEAPASAPPTPARDEAEASRPLTLARSDTPLPRLPGVASRAAELAARARQLAARSAEINHRIESDPQVARVIRELQGDAPPPKDDTSEDRLAAVRALAGARLTSQGILFICEAARDAEVEALCEIEGIAVRFPMRYGPTTGVHESIARLRPGKVRYRFLIDGLGIHDPRNAEQEADASGEVWSVIRVPDASPAAAVVGGAASKAIPA